MAGGCICRFARLLSALTVVLLSRLVARFGRIDRSIGEPPCARRCRRTDARESWLNETDLRSSAAARRDLSDHESVDECHTAETGIECGDRGPFLRHVVSSEGPTTAMDGRPEAEDLAGLGLNTPYVGPECGKPRLDV
jgi:hypothetical protein